MAACPMCGGGKARRSCPALGHVICATCCGTKRLVEIRCPADCGWLQAARQHPHAAQQRQQERDSATVMPLLHGLNDTEYGVLVTCLQAAVAARRSAVPRPLDADLQAAVVALAATAETSSRGVLYEHVPDEQGMPVASFRMKAYRRAAPDAAVDGFFEFLERVLQPQLADGATGHVIHT